MTTPTLRAVETIRALIDNHEATDAWWSTNWDCSGSPGHPGYPTDDIVREKARTALATLEALLRESEKAIEAADMLARHVKEAGERDDSGVMALVPAYKRYVDTRKKLQEQVP